MRFGCIILTLMFLLSACKQEYSPPEPIAANSFQYKAYDTSGTLIVTGWFTLVNADSIHRTGEWHFALVNNYRAPGPQVGDGTLKGIITGGLLEVNLNPSFVDNNVFLTGTLNGNNYNGTWTWSGFPGLLNRGSFRASK